MTQQVKWYIPNRVLLVHAWDELRTDDIHLIINGITDFFRERSIIAKRRTIDLPNLNLYLIVDASDLTGIHAQPTAPMAVARALRQFPDFKHVFIVGQEGNAFFRFFLALSSKLTGVPARMFPTAALALSYLEQLDPTFDFSATPLPSREQPAPKP